jgi:superfamily II DNA/RNA helicase
MHFAEMITRRLRLELSSERQAEPQYTHSLPKLEHTAHYFLNSARYANGHEATAYYHESAILFEQVNYLLKYKNIPEGPDARYRDNQAVLSALTYYLAGYEANSIVLAKRYLDGALPKNWTTYGAFTCLFLSKQFIILRQYINEIWNERHMPDVDEYEDDSALGELTYLAADRATAHAAMCFMDYLRTEQDKELEESLRSLSLAAYGYDACGDTIGACITRTLGLALQTLAYRSLHVALSDYHSTTTDLLKRYARLLLAGDKPVSELWRSQLKLAPHILNEDGNAVISLPTSAGKTRLAELAILRSLDRDPDKKALYLVPTRALAAEVEMTLGQHFGPLGYRVSALFGGYDLSDFEDQIIDECQILVTTPEKCDLLIRSKDDFLSNSSLVICDEGHQVGGGTRGVTYEFVLSRILWHATKSSTRIIMLSAVLSNLDVVSKWLHAGIAQEDRWKPTQSRLVYFGWSGNSGQLLFLDENLKVGTQHAFVPGVLDREHTQKSRDGWIGSLAIHFAGVGTTLVFTPRPAQCEKLAKKICNIIKKAKIDTLSKHQDLINEKHIPFIEQVIGKDHALIQSLSKGIAFHHGRLPHPVRIRIENMVRSGLVPIIVANETLAQGVNLPIKAIIIDKLNRGTAGNLVSVRDFWNIAGRAGRAGKEVEGYIVFVQDGDDEHIQDYIFRYFEDGRYEPTTSILLTTICDALLPRYYEIWDHAKKVQEASGQRYAQFWPAAIDLTVSKAEELLPLEEYMTLREALEAELKEKLAPDYHYNRDREHWADVLTEALRRILLSDILSFDTIRLTSNLWKNLLAPIDSQLLATIVEDILANQGAVEQFLASTLFGTEVSESHPLFKAFGKGLQARYSYICKEVPDPNTRKLFNSTGLSVGGNKIIEANRDELLEVIGLAIENPSTRENAIVQILTTAHEIPDLYSEEESPRTIDLILDWVAGNSLEEIAMTHFGGNLGDAVRAIERDIVRKIPWGVNAIIQHIKAVGLYLDGVYWLNNLPAMVGFGVPSPVSAYVAAQGISSRLDCIVISEAFASEEEGENYHDFIIWFSSLYQRNDVTQILSKAGDIRSILEISEQRSRGYKGVPTSLSIQLKKNYDLVDGQEVLFFHTSDDKDRYKVLTTKYSRIFTLRSSKLSRWIGVKDYIAKYVQSKDYGKVVVDFI